MKISYATLSVYNIAFYFLSTIFLHFNYNFWNNFGIIIACILIVIELNAFRRKIIKNKRIFIYITLNILYIIMIVFDLTNEPIF